MSMPPPPTTPRTNNDNGGQEEEEPPSMSPLHYHVPGVSSPTSSPEESIDNNNNNPEEEYQQQDDFLFLNLEDIFQQQQQQRSQDESGQHPQKLASSTIAVKQQETKQQTVVRMTTTSSPAASSTTTTRGGGGVSTPRPSASFDHHGNSVVPIPGSSTLSPLLFTPPGRGSSGSSSGGAGGGDNSPAPPPITTTTMTTTLARPTPAHYVPTMPLNASSSSSKTTANNNNNNNNTASFGSDDTAPPFVFADNDEDDDDDYHTSLSIALPLSPPTATRGGGGGASIFRLTRRKQGKHERRSSSSSEMSILSHHFEGAGILQRACAFQDSTTSASLGGLDEKQGSFADADDHHSGGGLLPNFDKQIHSDTTSLVKPTACSPAISPMHDETKRQEYDDNDDNDDTKEEEKEELQSSGEYDYDAGSATKRFLRERLFTVRLSSSPVVASSESMRRGSREWTEEVANKDSRGSFNTTSAATNPDGRIIPFDTTKAAGTMLTPRCLLEAEAGRALMNLMFFLALMAAFSTCLLNDRGTDIVSVALAGINIFIALLTIRNASRYRNRIQGPLEVMDVTSCLYSKASLIFHSGFAVFVTSILFTVARIIGLQLLEDVSSWVNIVANIGVVVTIPHFSRQVFDLVNLWSALSKKAGVHQSRDLRTVRYLTLAQIFLTLLLLGASIVALVALSWNAIVKGLGKITSMPFWIALGTAAVITTSFALEHYVRYNTTRCYPHPGLICELFREEIDEIFHDMSNARAASTNNNLNDNDIPQDPWEQTAKEFLHQYRFDIIFSPGRLAAVLQYLQSDTMEPCNEI